jgi:hypothetical protein
MYVSFTKSVCALCVYSPPDLCPQVFAKHCSAHLVHVLFAQAFIRMGYLLRNTSDGVDVHLDTFYSEIVNCLKKFLTPKQRKWVVDNAATWFEEEMPDAFRTNTFHLASVAKKKVRIYAARLGLNLELSNKQCGDLPYLFVYAFTAHDTSRYGERADLQMLISALVALETEASVQCAAGLRFLDVSALFVRGTINPKFIFGCDIYVQTCLALLHGTLLVRWYSDKDGTRIGNVHTTTMDYSFPLPALKRFSVTDEHFDTVVAALASYAPVGKRYTTAHSIAWLEDKMPTASDVFRLREAVVERVKLNELIASFMTTTRASPEFKAQVEAELSKNVKEKRGMKRAHAD